MTHDYKLALAPIEYEIEMRKLRGFEQTPLSDKELEAIRKALEIAIALQPKPISEAPKNGDNFYALVDGFLECCYISNNKVFVINNGDYNYGDWGKDYECGDSHYSWATHFYDISALPKPEVTE